MVAQADIDGDGKINYQELHALALIAVKEVRPEGIFLPSLSTFAVIHSEVRRVRTQGGSMPSRSNATALAAQLLQKSRPWWDSDSTPKISLTLQEV